VEDARAHRRPVIGRHLRQDLRRDLFSHLSGLHPSLLSSGRACTIESVEWAAYRSRIFEIPLENYSVPYYLLFPELASVSLSSGMTVIAAYINRDGEAVVVSDSCVANSVGNCVLRHNAMKTIRLNDEWGLALAGDNRGSALLGTILYGKSVIAQDTFAEIERRRLTRDDLVGEAALEKLSQIFSDPEIRFDAISGDCHVLLVGGNGPNHGLWQWPSIDNGWSRPDHHQIMAGNNQLVIVTPDRIAYAHIGVPVEEAMAKVLTYYAERYPASVDTNMTLRRMSCKFILERPSP